MYLLFKLILNFAKYDMYLMKAFIVYYYKVLTS